MYPGYRADISNLVASLKPTVVVPPATPTPVPSESGSQPSTSNIPRKTSARLAAQRTLNKRPSAENDISQSSRGSKKQRTSDRRESSRDSKKQEVGAKPDDGMLQCASYALELLSHGGLRNHVIGAYVSGDTIQLLYYDRSIILVSDHFDFVEYPLRLVAILEALAKFNERHWGYVYSPVPSARLEPEPPRHDQLLNGTKLRLKNNCVLTLKNTLHHQHGLIGRGTCVVQAICKPALERPSGAWEDNLIVKFSWPSASRTPEPTIINNARDFARKDDTHNWVLNHLPEVLYTEDIDFNLLSPELIDILGDKYEKRVLRVIVQEELFPITDCYTAPELAQAFREIFHCNSLVNLICVCLTFVLCFVAGYQWLVEHPRILHRDISLNNLMLRRKNGKTYGILNDFDLAVFEGQERSLSKQRTGTRPYMAIDLLEKKAPKHRYRHDLESMVYVFLWITSGYEDGEEIENAPLKGWFDLGDEAMAKEKTFFIVHETPQLTKAYEPLTIWANMMREMILDGYSQKSKYRSRNAKRSPENPFDDATLGGFISFPKFKEILDTDID